MARDMTPRQVAEAYLAAWNAHDADAAATLMADDVTISRLPSASRRKGVMQRVTRSSSFS